MVILHTNDMHGKLNVEAAEKLKELRPTADFYFDCGDCVKSGNIAIPLSVESVWARLADARCTASVPGNREFHVTEAGFRAKLAGCKHPVLAANLKWKGGKHQALLDGLDTEDDPLPSELIIGDAAVFGVMVPMVTDGMAAKHLSAFVNTSPIKAAKACVERLRGSAKTLICLSHIGLAEDLALAAKVPGIDLILGGHSHTFLEEPNKVGETWVCQTGSHARFAGRYTLEAGALSAEFFPLR
ncbi:MAG: metallophosphoesterase [Armatimonadetes bacterium]|nr:metallophosphoesterase [Armatimonadota bacterium]